MREKIIEKREERRTRFKKPLSSHKKVNLISYVFILERKIKWWWCLSLNTPKKF
jgi:hypothetical protein